MKLLSALFVYLAISFTISQDEIPPVFTKLEGNWQRIGKADNFEYWEKKEGNVLVAESYKVADGEKIILEKITIEHLQNSWYYIPDVPHNPAPVNFQITDMGRNHFYSENPQHDFPKWIRYEFSGSDSLNVMIGDKKDTIYFHFFRSI